MNAQYIATNINILSLSDRYIVANILVFRGHELIQTNNGAYIHLTNIDENTMNEIYNCLKTKSIFLKTISNHLYTIIKMSQQKRGRPIKNNNKVEINNLIVEFLAKKENNYGAEICYMKVIDKDARKNETHN